MRGRLSICMKSRVVLLSLFQYNSATGGVVDDLERALQAAWRVRHEHFASQIAFSYPLDTAQLRFQPVFHGEGAVKGPNLEPRPAGYAGVDRLDRVDCAAGCGIRVPAPGKRIGHYGFYHSAPPAPSVCPWYSIESTKRIRH